MLVPILLPVSLKRGAEVVRSHNAGGGVLRGPAGFPLSGDTGQGQRVPAGEAGKGATGKEYVEGTASREAAALRRAAACGG